MLGLFNKASQSIGTIMPKFPKLPFNMALVFAAALLAQIRKASADDKMFFTDPSKLSQYELVSSRTFRFQMSPFDQVANCSGIPILPFTGQSVLIAETDEYIPMEADGGGGIFLIEAFYRKAGDAVQAVFEECIRNNMEYQPINPHPAEDIIDDIVAGLFLLIVAAVSVAAILFCLGLCICAGYNALCGKKAQQLQEYEALPDGPTNYTP